MRQQHLAKDQSDDSKPIYIVEYVNMVFTLLFLLYFLVRIIKIKHFADCHSHAYKYPQKRIFLAVIYIILSVGLLIDILFQLGEFSTKILERGGGQCINSLILCLMLVVLYQELQKERPYTRCHLIYSFYLTLISFFRLGYSIYLVVNKIDDQIYNYVNFGITSILALDTFAMLVLWWKERKNLPQFQYFTIQNVKNNISFNISSHKSDTYQMQTTTNILAHQYIFPTVLVEKEDFKIILEIFVEDNILKGLDETNFFKEEKQRTNGRHLEIISNKIYTFQQVKELYIKCNRVTLTKRLKFSGQIYLGSFYQELQVFLDELFGNQKNYVPEIFELFDISDQSLTSYRKKKHDIQKITGKPRNQNSLFISLSLYKQFWIDDHYIFFLDVRVMDGKDHSLPYKRYSDFELFHESLQIIIEEFYKGEFILPTLPKKQFFYWDQTKRIAQRKSQLEKYCQFICNDYTLMSFPQAREQILNFFDLKNTVFIAPSDTSHREFYKRLEVKKGKIFKEDDVTYYEFVLFRDRIYEHNIKKRFSDFVKLHEELERWMKNIQIQYKFIELPEKHLFKSEEYRHAKLKKYLDSLITITEIYKVYSVNCFFDIFSKKKEEKTDQSLSTIKKISEVNPDTDKADRSSKQEKVKDSLNSSYISNGRMSRLIDELGD